MSNLSSIEICAGAGGQALGVERAGFAHEALVEIEAPCRKTLLHNRPHWQVVEGEQCDVNRFSAAPYKNIDLFAGGVPCPPFSKAGRQLGANDERDLFPAALRLIDECRPHAVMLENVRGFLDPAFTEYRSGLKRKLAKLGYVTDWRLLSAADFGVSQLRPRVVIIALRKEHSEHFSWPTPQTSPPLTVGELLYEQIAANGWRGAKRWKNQANSIAPTIVGGSKKHGGPDLGPTRAKRAWANLGVDGMGIANAPPEESFTGMPRLTVEMVARIQGFPSTWHFTGKKTPAYRQVGNAFPPPVAQAVATELKKCLSRTKTFTVAS